MLIAALTVVDASSATLLVVRYAGVDVAGADGTLAVDVRRPGACAGRRTCLFTGDRRLVNRSDAVVFSDTTPPHEFPAYRTPRQKWILRTMEVDSVPDCRREGPLWGTKVRRYNRGSAGSLGWPFPMLKYKYIFRKKIHGSSFIRQHSETVMV